MNIYNEYLRKGEKEIKGHRKQNNKDPFSLHSSPPSKKKKTKPKMLQSSWIAQYFL